MLGIAAIVCLGMWQQSLASTRQLRWDVSAPFSIVLATIGILTVWSIGAGRRLNLVPLVAALALAGVGRVIVARLEPSLAMRDALSFALGAVAFMVTVAIARRVDRLAHWRSMIATTGIVLLLATFALGRDPNGSGAYLWLDIGGFSFQPSEATRIAMVVFLASYLADYASLLRNEGLALGPLRLPPVSYLTPLAGITGVALLSLVVQRDLGVALLFFATALAMLYAATGRLVYGLGGLAIFAGGVSIATRLFPHAGGRIDAWLDPWARADTGGYQTVQGLIALAAGGLTGQGIGLGLPRVVPAVHTDLILAAIGEELGLFGSTAVVALLACLVSAGFMAGLAHSRPFARLLAVGLSASLGLQSIVIIGGTLGLLPLTGVTLPFVSFGGSSMLCSFVALGLIVAASRRDV
jgi:cell division protein FtsW (lipid II flippase)